MQSFTRDKYFFYCAFMLVASTFLPLVFNNLPPIIRSHHLWTAIWVISLLIYYPNLVWNKLMAYVLFYGLVLFLFTQTIWVGIDDLSKKGLFMDFYSIAIGVSVFIYFHQRRDYINFAKITKWALIFLFITAIMTIIASTIDPMYARNITALSAVDVESEREAVKSFKHYGGGTYSTAVAFMCLFPIVIYYFKNIQISIISKKQILAFSFVIFMALIGMQIFTNILIASFFGILSFFGMKKLQPTLIVITILITLIMLIPKDIYVNGLIATSRNFEKDSELNNKFQDLAIFIETGSEIEDNNTGVGSRAGRYPILWDIFEKSPILGCWVFSDENANGYNNEGVHLFWMNKLTTNGIMGLFAFLIIIYSFIKRNLNLFDSSYKFYYILASLAILSYGLMKALAGRDTWYTFFIILPGMYYLPLLKTKQ